MSKNKKNKKHYYEDDITPDSQAEALRALMAITGVDDSMDADSASEVLGIVDVEPDVDFEESLAEAIRLSNAHSRMEETAAEGETAVVIEKSVKTAVVQGTATPPAKEAAVTRETTQAEVVFNLDVNSASANPLKDRLSSAYGRMGKSDNVSEKNDETSVRELLISYKRGLYSTLTFNDGVKTLTIDLNSILPDPFKIEFPDVDMNTTALSAMMLQEIVLNFYPGLIIPLERFSAHARHISKFEDDRFIFFEHNVGITNGNNLIYGYFISEKSYHNFMLAAADMDANDRIGNFLTAIEDITWAHGFSFRHLNIHTIKQITMLDETNNLNKAFVTLMLDGDGVVVDDNHINETPYDVIQIIPYEFTNPVLDAVLHPDDDDDEEYEDEDEDEEDDEDLEDDEESEDEEESDEEPESEDDFDKDETGMLAYREAATEPEEESEDDESGLLDDVEDAETVDPEEEERAYYSSKGKKMPKPDAPKRRPSDDDQNWVVPVKQ